MSVSASGFEIVATVGSIVQWVRPQIQTLPM